MNAPQIYPNRKEDINHCPECGEVLLYGATLWSHSANDPIGNYRHNLYCECGYFRTEKGRGKPTNIFLFAEHNETKRDTEN